MLAQIERGREMGQIFGLLFWSLLLLIVTIRCWRLAQRPDACRPCVLALAAVLLGWMVSCVMIANRLWTPQAGLVSNLTAIVVMLLLGLVALFLAIKGLIQYNGKVHRHGRAHAVWAMILASLFGFISYLAAWEVYYHAKSEGATWVPLSASGIRNATYFENCSLERPPHWVGEIYPERISKPACIAFRRSNPEAYATVVAEFLDDGVDLATCMQAVKSNIDGVAKAIVEDKTTNVVIDGQPFLQRTATVKMGEGPTQLIYSELWVTAVPGYSWRIMCWGPASHRELLEPQFKRIGESFRITDKQLNGPKRSR